MEELDECKLEQKKSNRDILMDQIKQIKQTYTNQLSKS